jgi:hypothetical protein
MYANRRVLATIAAIPVIMLGAGACASSSQPTHPAAQVTAVQLPTARQIANQLHGTGFKADHVAPATTEYAGEVYSGQFFIGQMLYTVKVYNTPAAMDESLKLAKKMGLTPKWQGTSWVIVPSDTNFTGPTLPLPMGGK